VDEGGVVQGHVRTDMRHEISFFRTNGSGARPCRAQMDERPPTAR
jgi:hypothetical protein